MQSNLIDVRVEGTGAMVVLAVHIVGNRPADSYKPCARSYWEEPSLGKHNIDDVGKTDAGFAADHARRLIESKDAIEAAAIDQFAAVVETGVAITASESVGKQRSWPGGIQELRNLIVPCRLVYEAMRDLGITSPRKNSSDGRKAGGLFS